MWSDVTEHQSGYRNVLDSLHWSRFYVIERKRATDSTLNLLLIWQFVDLLRTAEAIWPEQVQKRSFLLCINVAAQSSRGGVSQGLVLGSHGIQLLTPCQLYSQPGARIESQWGRKQGCKLQTLQGYLSGHQWQRPFLWLHSRTQPCTHRLQRDDAAFVFSCICGKKKRSICTMHISDCRPSNPVKTLLNPFEATSLDMA